MFATTLRAAYVDTAFGQIHYRTAGLASATPLVLLHQTASSSAMFEPLMAELGTDFWLIAPDTPGFGASFRPPAPPTVAFYAQALHQALLALGIASCNLFGHHTGAAIAVQMAHDHPGFVRKLALAGPPLLSEQQKENLSKGLRPFAIAEDGTHLTQVWERIRSRDPALPLQTALREVILTLAAGESAQAAYRAVFEQDFAGQLAALDLPILLLAGEHDTLRASLEPALALLKHGQAHIIAGATTYVCDREAPALAAHLHSFFSA